MALSDYIGAGETIKLRFGTSIQYFVFQILMTAAIFSAMAWLLRPIFYFMWIIIGAGAIFVLHRAFVFFTTRYFVTEKKIYKKIGIFWTKVLSSKKEEIEHIEIRQGFADKFFFRMGSIIFKTATVDTQIDLKNVADPFQRRKQIETVWA